MIHKHDLIIVGAGLAGLRAAVETSAYADVAVISKPTRSIRRHRCIAARSKRGPNSIEWHIFDTAKEAITSNQDAYNDGNEAPDADMSLNTWSSFSTKKREITGGASSEAIQKRLLKIMFRRNCAEHATRR
jgi:succinate dehydrogenase/fumarate reductase flavoprotein subunit